MSLLSLEAPIVARLKSQLPTGTHVLTESSLDLDKGRLKSPAVYVMFHSGVPSEGDYQWVYVDQQWAATAVVRNVSSPDGANARADVDALAALVVDALQGWTPAGATMPLSLAGTPAPDFVDGFMMLSTVYKTRIELDLA